jgi:hypothetical protein
MNRVPEPIELTGMVVEDDEAAAERRGGERDSVREEKSERCPDSHRGIKA